MKQRLLPLLLIVAITLALLALAEGGTRLVLRLRDGVWPQTAVSAVRRQQDEVMRLYRRHPFLNTAPRAGVLVHAFGKQASFNSLGYRSPERPLERPPGATRILCEGGSTTFDLLAASDQDTWPWRLEEKLKAAHPRVEVWNAGFPGWTSLENVISLAERDADLAPQWVVLFQGDNDLQPGGCQPFDRQYEHCHAGLVVRALGFDPPPVPWRARSVLLERLRAALGRPVDPWASLDPGEIRHPRLEPAAVATFARNVRSLIGIARVHGARVALVTQTVRIRAAHRADDLRYLAQWLPGLQPEAAPSQLERLNDVLRALAADPGAAGGAFAGDSSGGVSAARSGAGAIAGVGARAGGSAGDVVLLDAAARLPWQDEDFSDPLHFSGQGSERLAAYLAGALPWSAK